MSGYMDGFQAGVAESDDISVVQVLAEGDWLFREVETEHTALFGRFVYPKLIGLVGFGFQPEFFQHERVSEDVVKVQMGVEQVCYVQIVARDEVLQVLLLFVIKASGVDDHGFVCLVPKHVAVLREHIEFKSLDFHGSLFFSFQLSKFILQNATNTTFFVWKYSSSK